MKIIADSNIPFVEEAFKEFGEVIPLPGREITNQVLKDATMILVRSITKVDEELLKGTKIKFVATATIGTDHIDTQYLKEHCIGFASAPGSNADSVAEYVLAALLKVLDLQHKGIQDYTLGIIGVGNVGSRVFEKCNILGIRCLLNDPPKERQTQSPLYLPLDKVLEESDIISLHVPLIMSGTDKTVHLVNSEFLQKMKKDSIFINTSRGKVVDEEQFIAIAQQTLAAIVLDVWETEPNPRNDLINMIDIATPHIAGYAYASKILGTGMIHEAACSFFFKEKEWDMDSVIEQLEKKDISVSNSEFVLYEAIEKAYDIGEDDRNLREIIDIDKTQQGKFFDNLRKQYPERKSFSLCNILAKELSIEHVENLQSLGFAIK